MFNENTMKYVVEKGVAKREQIAIVGYSYGGYMTLLALGRYPDLWTCGVAGAGIADWSEQYELSDAVFKKFIEVLFAGKKELFRDRSPITYVDNIRVPVCIIHPQNDTRCPLKPMMKLVEELMKRGRVFELHVLPDLGHNLTKVSDIAKYLVYTLMFLKKYLG